MRNTSCRHAHMTDRAPYLSISFEIELEFAMGIKYWLTHDHVRILRV